MRTEHVSLKIQDFNDKCLKIEMFCFPVRGTYAGHSIPVNQFIEVTWPKFCV